MNNVTMKQAIIISSGIILVTAGVITFGLIKSNMEREAAAKPVCGLSFDNLPLAVSISNLYRNEEMSNKTDWHNCQ